MKKFKNFDLTKFNSYNITSCCEEACFPETEAELINCYLDEPDQKKIILGNGNNIILSKAFYKARFIILNGCLQRVKIKDNLIEAEAGATLKALSEQAFLHQLSGLEIFHDIPSSMGGAVVMNAGTKEAEIKDLLVNVRYFDPSDCQVKEMNCEEIGFSYRNSFFQKNPHTLILKAWLRMKPGNSEEIKKKMKVNQQVRWSRQPRSYPNCGSVFKRPEGAFVGPMLDELGFKGFSIGGAMVSPKHSGFIVNKKDATGQDVIDLITEIKNRVMESFKITLEIEQRII